MTIKFVVPGRAVPYKRMTQKSKFVNTDAQRYLAYKQYVKVHAKIAMNQAGATMITKGRPIEFGCKVYLKGGLDADLSNYIKGIEDALNKLVYEDDRWIVRYIGMPEKVFVSDKNEERVEIEVRRA